jgi:hypothetical protein
MNLHKTLDTTLILPGLWVIPLLLLKTIVLLVSKKILRINK